MDSFTIKGQSGVQMLLSAEQEAQQIVSSARSLKMTRLKQAKDEADREIALYRTQMDKEFQNKISESTGNSGATVKRLEEETELKIKSLNDKSSKVSKQVVGMIKRYVTTVKN